LIENPLLAVAGVALESVTWAVKGNDPEDEGVPESWPLAEFSVMPPGKLPETMDQVYGLTPPEAVREAE
jgi:hypothetical protein